jgi:hypothetical protein
MSELLQVSVIWRESGAPSFFAPKPIFSFHELPEIHVEAPAPYAAARFEMLAREYVLGAEYYQHIAELGRAFYLRKRPWWL